MSAGARWSRWSPADTLPFLAWRVVLPLLVLLSPGLASADVNVTLQLSADTIEVGQSVRVVAKASSSDDTPPQPTVKIPPGFDQHGPSIGTSHQMSFVNGRVERSTAVTATWEIAARRSGEFTLGPAEIRGPQGRARSQTVRLKVVPPGSLPQRPSRRSRGFFDDDFFNPGSGSPFDDLFNRRRRGPPEAPEEYRTEHAPDKDAFLRAVVSDDDVVIGEQVTVSIYAYGGRGAFREGNSREPRRPDFYSYPLVDTSGRQRVYMVDVAGRRYQAVLVRRFALVPLKTGTLEVGPMEMTFLGSGYRGRTSLAGLVRTTEPLKIRVSEPPEQGRPADYQLGDVGRFKLTAQVAPRNVERGDTFSVTATLEGTGHLPSQLVTPELKGLVWLEPTVKEQISTDRQGRIGGTRTFTYVVEAQKTGKQVLGELRLPYYDPQARRYGVARAALGAVEVSPPDATGATPQPEDEQSHRISDAMQARKQLQPLPERRFRLADTPWFWWANLLLPLTAIALTSAGAGWNRLWQRRRSESESASRQASKSFKEARSLAAAGDLKAACSAAERAVFLSIEDRTGIKGRALVRAELERELINAGTTDEAAREVSDVLKGIDELRFAGEASQSKELLQRAESAVGRVSGKRSKANT